MPRRTDPRDPLNRLEHLIGLGFWAVFVKLERIEQQIALLTQQEETEMATVAEELARVGTEVNEITDAVEANSTLLATLSQLIRDNVADPAALTDLADRLDATGAKLVADVLANTPASPEPPA